MSRSGYDSDCEYLDLYRHAIDRAVAGKRGQQFLKELAVAMDAMPVKRLIEGELIDKNGECCTIGVVCKARGIDVKGVDVYDPSRVGGIIGIATSMAAEIAFENDEKDSYYVCNNETPEQRWARMRKWVQEQIRP